MQGITGPALKSYVMTQAEKEIKEQLQAIQTLQPHHGAAITEGGLDLGKIEFWLSWLLTFIQFFDKGFKTKSGEYKKPWIGKALKLIGLLFKLGLQLIFKK